MEKNYQLQNYIFDRFCEKTTSIEDEQRTVFLELDSNLFKKTSNLHFDLWKEYSNLYILLKKHTSLPINRMGSKGLISFKRDECFKLLDFRPKPHKTNQFSKIKECFKFLSDIDGTNNVDKYGECERYFVSCMLH